MKEFYIGQKVVVSDTGENYTTYGEMAKKMNLSNWSEYNNCPIGEELTIVAKEIHENDVAIVYGLRGEDGVEYLAGGRYFSLAKPTQTEYVKVTESIFDLREEFENGDLYFKVGAGDFHKIDSESCLTASAVQNAIYRRIEKEVDWSEVVNNYFFKTKWLGIDCSIEESITESNYREEFLEMCRVALRATGELPE